MVGRSDNGWITHNTSHIDDTPPHVRGVADAAP